MPPEVKPTDNKPKDDKSKDGKSDEKAPATYTEWEKDDVCFLAVFLLLAVIFRAILRCRSRGFTFFAFEGPVLSFVFRFDTFAMSILLAWLWNPDVVSLCVLQLFGVEPHLIGTMGLHITPEFP
ncbi:hypothetical protein BJ508DRAFT_312661 [Ascobolus immersus RN42]|uniref:Uncharacterized protein n=1 Tax=Ascobolus immersus RN42 TaxID=1160509 RepID=A0A3N4HSB5_ASCIM|nr:hypothetical protein BJ508DRAFT_312661 [Ascobolus immersus RN42]